MSNKAKIKNRVKQCVRAKYQLIDVNEFKLGECSYNSKCHINAVQAIKKGTASKVYSCFAIEKDADFCCVHFINQLENGKYQDNTWGWTYTKFDYYLIKEITPSEQDKIWNSLSDTQNMLWKQNTNALQRLIFKSWEL